MTAEFVKKFNDKSTSRQELFNNHDFETIANAIIKNSANESGILIWNAIFKEIKDDDQFLFEVCKNVLPKLNRDKLPIKTLNDFYSMLNIDLSKNRTPEFVLKIALLCEEFVSIGDERAAFWKELLPIALKILQKRSAIIEHERKSSSGKKLCQEIIDRILLNSPPISALTAFVSMFKDIELNQQQQDLLITKVSGSIDKVNHHEDVGNLALAIFQTALFNQLLIPILSLDKYFYKHRYRKEMNETASDIDSIDMAAEENVIETEEITIYHFQNVAEYTSIERDLTNAINALKYTPKYILSPFIATLMVSIAKISNSVEGNFRLNQSNILPLLKQIFKFNEEHKEILRTSGWAASVDQPTEIVNTDALLMMLKQNTCGLKQNIALNGLFGLSFLLLKTKASPALNKFAIEFLNEIIKKRQEFTADILKIVVKMLFCEENKTPIVQCLSTILQNRYLDINAAQHAMRNLIEDLTELDINTALAIESVIFTAISKSIALRDKMIEVMKSAMYQKNIEVRKMAVFSFCVMLRKFTKPPRSSSSSSVNNEHRYSHNISFFSLTQSQIAISNINSNIRQVEIMMLEILGMLKKCFSETSELKVTLYDSLLSSITANTFIVPNVLEFIDVHFRNYFDLDEDDSRVINFDKSYKLIGSNDEETIVAMDDLGCLLKFIINCVIIASAKDESRQENINYDLNLYKNVLSKLMERVLCSKLSHLEINDNELLEKKHTVIVPQFLNCIEALMIYCLHEGRSTDSHEYFDKIPILFEKHQKVREKVKKILESKKKKADKRVTMTAITKMEINSTCVWDLKECSHFLKIITDDSNNDNVAGITLKENREFIKFVWRTTNEKIQSIEKAPEHSKLKHSREIFDTFLSCSVQLFNQLKLENFSQIFNSFGIEYLVDIAEGMKNVAQVLEKAFYNKREKLNSFLRAVTSKNTAADDSMLAIVIGRIQKVVDWIFKQSAETVASIDGSAILCNLLNAIQIFAGNFQKNKSVHSTFNWILNLAKTVNIAKDKNLSAQLLKLLLQLLNQHENATIIDCIAHKIATCYEYRFEQIDEPENASQNNYTIISKHSADEAFCELIEFIKHQLHIIDVYTKRIASFNSLARLKGQESHESISAQQNIESAVAMKLISLGKSLERITNSKFPLQSARHVEKLTTIIRSYYVCMTNLMKHFRKHHNIKNVISVALEELMKYSRTFAKSVYGVVKYIGEETSVAVDNKKATAKGSVMSKTKKSIPKVILMLENFNKSVADFDVAAKKNFSKLIHPGEVRDFYIDKKLIAANESENTDNDENNGNSEEEVVAVASKKAPKRRANNVLSSDTSSSENEAPAEEEEVHDTEVVEFTRERLEQNLKQIKKAKATVGRKKRVTKKK